MSKPTIIMTPEQLVGVLQRAYEAGKAEEESDSGKILSARKSEGLVNYYKLLENTYKLIK